MLTTVNQLVLYRIRILFLNHAKKKLQEYIIFYCQCDHDHTSYSGVLEL